MTSLTSQAPKEVLLIEDNPGDVLLANEALNEAKARMHLSVAGDGVEAMAFLRHQGTYFDVVRPDLVLFDLNLSRKNGWEVLAEIKADSRLKNTSVIIFSVSKAEEDVRHAYDLQANCYIAKPGDLDQLISIARS